MDADDAGDAAREPLLQRVIVGWDGVEDESGEALPCTPENVTRLTRIGYVGSALARRARGRRPYPGRPLATDQRAP